MTIMKTLLPLQLAVALLFVTPYIYNIVKLADCDFKEDYACEIIHAAGVVVPPAAFVTVWFGVDE